MGSNEIQFEELIDYQQRDLEENVIYPSKSWFKKKTYDKWDWSSTKRKLESGSSIIVITHNDADGLVSGAVFKDYYGNKAEVVPIEYDSIERTFNKLAEVTKTKPPEKVYVSDLNVDKVYPSIAEIAENVDEFVWFDHHEWGTKRKQLEDMGVQTIIDNSRCAARIVFDYFSRQKRYNPSSEAKYIIDVTEDHDLWIKNSEIKEIGGEKKYISDIISTLAFFSKDEKFMNNILDYGEEFLDRRQDLLNKDENFLEDKIRNDRKQRNYIIENETNIKKIGDYTVAFCYGRSSPGNLLEDLKSEGVNILVLVRPRGKISIRSDESFQYCHHITENMGGGGHEQSAGAFPDYLNDWGIPDYVNHWNQRGHTGLINYIEENIRTVIYNYG